MAGNRMGEDQMEKGIVAGGCSVPFGEPWPSNIARFSLLGDGRPAYQPTFIIGLGHKAQQGKDTLAAHLIETLGPRPEGQFGHYFPIDIRRYAFADELKVEVFDFLQNLKFVQGRYIGDDYLYPQFANHLLPEGVFSREEKIAWLNARKGGSIYSFREMLQEWGTEFRRAQDPDYWVKKTLARIQQEKPQVAVITDMRFLNETKICDVQINVVRPIQTSLVPPIPLHASETELDTFPYPYTIVGESVEDLKRKGFDLVEGLLQDRGLLPR